MYATFRRLIGDFDERRAAVSMILSKIAEDPHSASCPNCSYTHMQTNGHFETGPSNHAYVINTDSPMNPTPDCGDLRSGNYSTDQSISYEQYEGGSNSLLSRDSLTVYRNPASTLQASLSPILFTFATPEVTAISPSALGMMSSAYQPDFNQVVMNNTPQPRVITASPHLLNTPGIPPATPSQTSIPVPSAVGCPLPPPPLLTSFYYRSKLIPVPHGSELTVTSVNSTAASFRNTAPVSLSSWFPQTGHFNPIRLPMTARPTIPVGLLTSLPGSTLLPEEHSSLLQFSSPLRVDSRCAMGVIPTSYHQIGPSDTTCSPGYSDTPAPMILMSFRPVQTENREEVPIGPSEPVQIVTDSPKPGKELDAEVGATENDETGMTTVTGRDRSVVSHTRYCSGDSTDSALTASLTSLRLHSSIEEQPPDRVTQYSPYPSTQRALFPPSYPAAFGSATGTVPLLRFDAPGAPFTGNSGSPHSVLACSTSSSDYGLLEYSYIVPQALSSHLSGSTVYGATIPAPVGSEHSPANFQASPLVYTLPSFDISNDANIGLSYPSIGTGLTPTMGTFTSPGGLTPPGLLQLRYNPTFMNMANTAITDQRMRGGVDSISQVKLPDSPNGTINHIEPYLNGLSNSFCPSMPIESPSRANTPQTSSGLLLVGTMQQVQHALSVLNTQAAAAHPTTVTNTQSMGTIVASTATCPEASPTWTTSFVLEGPLRVDRIQPLSLPPDWSRSPVRGTPQSVL
ncbi:unnamed protein product [Echinostoma caproni]|uniref:C2H2-type domain-containing protein n=1 Tax=Echinostoma caproni TaxID=27848 RepID=A0A183AUY2_9TREM|nr:unnamed protein product [Echinostoma caproni]